MTHSTLFRRFICSFLLISITCSWTVSAARQRQSRSLLRTKTMDATVSKANSFLREELIPIASGCVAFYSTLGLSTCAMKMVGISTGTKALARVAGVPSVCAASMAGHRCALLVQEWSRNPQAILDHKTSFRILCTSSSSTSAGDYYEIANGGIRLPKQDVRACLTGLVAFKLLGGRFWAIAPSSYTKPGSFARQSLPATESYIGSGSKSDQLQEIYRKWGCHTCGSKAGSAIGDHMPPKSIGEHMKQVNYRFYAQCQTCSGQQGGILRSATSKVNKSWSRWKKIGSLEAAGGGSAAYNHGARFRINHLTGCLTAPRVIESDIAKELSTRVEKSDFKPTNIPQQWNKLQQAMKEAFNNLR